MVSILIRKFNGYYDKRPVFTTMITNAVGFTLEYFRLRADFDRSWVV